ncbi:81e4ad1c-ff53-4b31-96ff-86feb7e2e2d8 [Staphylotrichum tortipilum]|uniref:81e4ad1c-ff53-4b31-96ff-86feb7e2e2d8 n=1 Tax=Staphylotrichum tortipilum TaxID=2831512 RepID=A0AAN6RTN3_9PEZI|nr:81e4ad1c-ff53-4b31-96ff-86feb7e2e2d8 [Staphylotrichum longicolle]
MPSSLFGSHPGEPEGDSGSPANPGASLSNIDFSDQDSLDGLFVEQEEEEVKDEETDNDGNSGSSDEDTDSLDDSDNASGSGSGENRDRGGGNKKGHAGNDKHRKVVINLDDDDDDDGDDNDDDCLIITSESELPENVRSKFATAASNKPPDLFRIKVEEQDGVLAIPSDSERGGESESDLDFQTPDEDLSDGERPRKQDEVMDLCMRHEQLNTLKDQRPLTFPETLELGKISARLDTFEKMAATPLGDRHEGDGAAGPHEQSGGNPSNTTQARRRPQLAKTPKEYWERRYAEHGAALRSIAERRNKRARQPVPKRNRGPGRKIKNEAEDRAEARLMSMLQESDPVMARAAQGALAMPGPITATTRAAQFKALKNFNFRAGGSLNMRSADERIQLQADEKILKDAVQSFGFSKARACDGKWKVPGIKSPLYNHQMVAASWILRQEFSPAGPYGGMLCDQMGLGKTVEILAGMSGNRPTHEDRMAGRHQTLIVAPAPAIDQWKREIKKHCDPSFIRGIHHYRAVQRLEPMMWQTADIILASYHEVARAYPSDKALKLIAGKKLENEEWAELFEQNVGELMGHEFFRVILDEGHTIRNHKTKMSKACLHLTSKYRWILSGTPLHNSVEELYPYFRFLGAHWAEDREEFSKQFGDLDKDDTRARIELVVTSIMLRRRVDDKFLGAPILEIPPTHEPVIIWVDLTVEERLIYRRLESRFRDNFNSDLARGNAHKKMKTYIVYCTRMRQGVGHPFMLEGVARDNFTLEDLHYLRTQLARVGGRAPMHKQLQRWVEMEYELAQGGDEDGERFGKGTFGGRFEIGDKLEVIEKGKRMGEVMCRLCYDSPNGAIITECGHTFCKECLEGALEMEPSCPTCKGVLVRTEVLLEPEGEWDDDQSDQEEDGDDDENGGALPRRKRERRKKKLRREVGDDENWAQPKMRDSSKWIREYDENYPAQELMASAKTVAVKNQVLLWQRVAPDDKIIIFVNWVKMGCIIGRMLREEEIPFLYYFGDLSQDEKRAAIADFQDNPNIKVLISSLRCGGQALNLTAANRVISVGQWWNSAAEQQAFGRVHRIGQTKEMYFASVLAKDTIDEGMLRLREEKARRIARALQEDGSGAGSTAFTVEDVKRLLGNGEDGEGEGDERKVIVVDDEEDEEGGLAAGGGDENMVQEEVAVGGDGNAEVVAVVGGDEVTDEPETADVVVGGENAGEEVVMVDGDEKTGEEVCVVVDGDVKTEEDLVIGEGNESEGANGVTAPTEEEIGGD